MLDDLKYIHERDAADTLGLAEKQYQQLGYHFTTPKITTQPEQIVYAAMGGSALAAQVSTTWPGYTVPFEIVRGYDIPAYVSPKTVVIVASYSGNTEETLSALTQAQQKGATIMVITAGGKLAKLAKQHKYPLALLPKIAEPRYGLLYNLRALLTLLQPTNTLAVADSLALLEAEADNLRRSIAIWRPDVATVDNPAKQLAQELMGKSIAIYAGPILAAAAWKWKMACNENAKQLAWTNQLPEFSHNEFTGWTKQPATKPYAVIDLRSSFDHPRIQKRFAITEQLLSGMRPAPQIVTAEGTTVLGQLLWTLAFGDFVSLYLALLNGLNPAPVELVEKFKAEMDA